MLIAVGSALALVVFAAVFVRALSRSGRPASPSDDAEASKPGVPVAAPQPKPGAPAPARVLDTARVLELMRAGEKIAAIKLYREQTGAGLAEAKTAVEALASGAPPPPPRPAAVADQAEVRRLAKAGQLIQAIKLHRELTGLGLAESKAAVEALRDGP